MTRRGLIIASIVWNVSVLAGQVPPESLARGRAIVVEDVTVDGAPKDTVAAALSSWQRFNVVSERDRADLVLTIRAAYLVGELALPTSSRDTSTPKRAYTMEVTDRASGQRLWSGSRDAGFSTRRTMSRLVEQFRRFVENVGKRSKG